MILPEAQYDEELPQGLSYCPVWIQMTQLAGHHRQRGQNVTVAEFGCISSNVSLHVTSNFSLVA